MAHWQTILKREWARRHVQKLWSSTEVYDARPVSWKAPSFSGAVTQESQWKVPIVARSHSRSPFLTILATFLQRVGVALVHLTSPRTGPAPHLSSAAHGGWPSSPLTACLCLLQLSLTHLETGPLFKLSPNSLQYSQSNNWAVQMRQILQGWATRFARVSHCSISQQAGPQSY